MNIRRIPFVIVILLMAFSCSTTNELSSFDGTTIYLIRHAEKITTTDPDPSLTSKGQERAENLGKMMAGKNLTHIYSTDFKRTRETATPASRSQKIPISLYDVRELDEFVMKLKEMKSANVLIVGHSNSTPTVANMLLGDSQFKQFREDEYGGMIIVQMKSKPEFRLSQY